MSHTYTPILFSQHNVKKAAFTLVEMAAVLVIIALLTGGVLTGQHLLKSAKLRDVQTSVEQYRKAIQQFNEIYGALPGDMANATTIWGARDGGDGLGVDCTDVASTDALTCNGNGDGYLGVTGCSCMAYESFRAWQHMKNADLIKGIFSGARTTTANPYYTTVGVNSPLSSLGNNIGYNVRYEQGTNMFTGTFPYHYILLGANTTNDYNDAVALGTSDAHNIDRKIDDGLPGQGTVVTYTNAAHSNCASTSVAATAAYQLSVDNATKACIMMFRINN
jgi:prepilin-type N-terminal cleavage/methylation domain-containing protein